MCYSEKKHFLIDPLLEIDEYLRLLEDVKRENPVTITGPSESQKAHMAYPLQSSWEKGCLHCLQRDSG